MQNIDSFSSGSEDECLAVITFALTKRKRKHRMWVKDLQKARSDSSNYNLVKEMAMGDREMYFRYMPMTPGRMEHLFNLVAPRKTKLSTNYRQPIPHSSDFRLLFAILQRGNRIFSSVCNTELDAKLCQRLSQKHAKLFTMFSPLLT